MIRNRDLQTYITRAEVQREGAKVQATQWASKIIEDLRHDADVDCTPLARYVAEFNTASEVIRRLRTMVYLSSLQGRTIQGG